ncbi:hypothetical protein QU487_06540 [Crenobacter sp. SG2305]|uniref:hypothetical protein n=1 Tax=Crenobacter oryzisoli TaxID=3056844 RepID=UPI0025AB5C5E|nr:hypothetical protein [Crenobacter sp. SG2305]MDN0082411.1 hypothetical protein [Crenobacter sp. SG2305]
MNEILMPFYNLLNKSAGFSPEEAAYIILASVIVLPMALLLLLLRWEEVSWYVWGRHSFKKWANKQNSRFAFLTTCGGSEPVALATVMQEALAHFNGLYVKVESQRWDSPYAKALMNWLDQTAERLTHYGQDKQFSQADRQLALEASLAYRENAVARIDQAIKFRRAMFR